MRRPIAALVIVVATGSILVSAGTAASPDPCKIVSTALIAAKFGSSPSGVLATQPGGPAKLTTCTYQRGSSKLEVSVGPAVIANGGFGGPATVSRTDPSFGPKGHLSYDTSAPYIYATVFFVKGPYYGSVWSNAVDAAGVITIANALYKKL